jgi:hypothetical protein
MSLFDFFKKKKPVRADVPKEARAPKKTEKDLATEQGEPWVNIVQFEFDKKNISNGAFELDWNDKFVADLVRQGYMMNPNDTDADIVDRWFTNVCRNIVMETWEQEEAIKKSGIYVQSRDLGDGRSEVS